MSRLHRARVVIAILATLALFLPWSSLSLEAAAPTAAGARVPDQYIITFTGSVADPGAKARGLAAQHGLTVLHVYRYALNGFAARVPAARLAQLQADPDIATIVQDRVVSLNLPAAQAKAGTSAATQPTQTVPTGIKRIDGDLSSTVSGNGSGSVVVDVAVIDTGIQKNHPDLNVVGGYNCTTPKTTAWGDGNGHGTHVAGTIGALDNGIGVVGVAPGARLWAVRVLNANGSGTWSGVICGVDYVTRNAGIIEVANMSLGGGGGEGSCTDGGLRQAICTSVDKGVTYAVAAGNSATDAKDSVPATYPEVITVSALADFNGLPGGGAAATCRSDVDDTFADFSNYGADVDIIAPGVCINSTWLNSGYNTISGTSMASPHVAGAAALYKAGHPNATPAEVKQALQDAGNLDWNNVDDRDGIKEKLLNVDLF